MFPLLYVFMGAMFVAGGIPSGPAPGPPPALIGWIMILFGGCFSGFFLTLGVLSLCTGYNLSKRKQYLFCFVDACLCCINIPLGTVLGVFTIIVLSRPSVKELFAAPHPERMSEPEA